MVPGQEIAIRAVGTALAGMSMAFAIYMLAYGGGKTRINGLEHLAIFAQPRGSSGAASPAEGPAPPTADGGAAVDMTTTGSFAASAGKAAPESRPIFDPAIHMNATGFAGVTLDRRTGVHDREFVPIRQHLHIVARDGGWALLDDKGAALLAVTKAANGAALFARKRIFE